MVLWMAVGGVVVFLCGFCVAALVMAGTALCRAGSTGRGCACLGHWTVYWDREMHEPWPGRSYSLGVTPDGEISIVGGDRDSGIGPVSPAIGAEEK